MTTIRLIGRLDLELTRLGFKSGDIIRNAIFSESNKAMYFKIFDIIDNSCVVYAENYAIVELPEKEKDIIH
ncbi:hypothetical protein LJC25_01985 [Bacteroidales bacterium OttesenSCG-928-K03]|nr:hypothetical protein [Odoribacter sp. OttesenSCG-928-L07]MDL2240166.1 hypothetical protein [Bacteroidales bacterium OttesenSCG-928-K22]MDL2242479.1 hypothetical protein [Bacteroidales bacterium OttesenSCG-928-K03]